MLRHALAAGWADSHQKCAGFSGDGFPYRRIQNEPFRRTTDAGWLFSGAAWTAAVLPGANHHSDSDECTDGLKAAFLGVLGGNADHAFVSGRSPLALPHMPRNLTMALGRYTVANRPHPPRWTVPALAAGGHRSSNRW